MIAMVAMVILLFFVLDGGIGGEASAPSISFPQNKVYFDHVSGWDRSSAARQKGRREKHGDTVLILMTSIMILILINIIVMTIFMVMIIMIMMLMTLIIIMMLTDH